MTTDRPLPPAPGTPVRVVMRKWGERPHWTSGEGAVYLGEDDHGWWYAVDEGVEFTRPGRSITIPALQIGCGARERWHSFVLHTRHPRHDTRVYVDVATPALWRHGEDGVPELTAIDLDLDVFEMMDGRVVLDDEDEFAEHIDQLGYPDDVIAAARAEADLVLAEVRAGAYRFSDAMLDQWCRVYRRLRDGSF